MAPAPSTAWPTTVATRCDYDDWARAGNAGWRLGRACCRVSAAPRTTPTVRDPHGARPRRPHPRDSTSPAQSAERGTSSRRSRRWVVIRPARTSRVCTGRLWPAPGHHIPRAAAIPLRGLCSSPRCQRPNLTLLTRAQVPSPSTSRAAAPRAWQLARQPALSTSIAAQREVLLCAGAIHSPQLLMLSGIGPARELRAMGIAVNAGAAWRGRQLPRSPGAGADAGDARLPPPTDCRGAPCRAAPGTCWNTCWRVAARWPAMCSSPRPSSAAAKAWIARTSRSPSSLRGAIPTPFRCRWVTALQ